ncbi:MAG: peptide ABC transporter ATP-binding protein [Chloroflexota bacterium]|nr:ABC transporter ATP-binding protein [Caldilinea sp.]GIK71029.1 MAG: peptide ABC transporter ATP-binding protein [Chloroflexota bacterium]
MPEPLLEIKNATKVYGGTGFFSKKRTTVALQDFNLTIDAKPATITTIAGESGSGKTTLANLVLGFVKITSGQVLYKGVDVNTMNSSQLFEYRREVQAVFQDPYAVYNPFYRVKHIFDMVLKNFKLAKSKEEGRALVEDALNVVGMRGEEVLEKYPHQLSGGQRQRMMVARAYMLKPRLIVADEPVSMVDASLRAMILDIMLRLRDEHNISFLYITHDLSTAYQIGDNIHLLYQGSVAERGNTVKVIENPKHPYVQLLINSIPVPDPSVKWGGEEVTTLDDEQMRTSISSGCRFYGRCIHRMDRCLEKAPPLYSVGEAGHEAACYLYESGVETPEAVAVR